MTRTVADRLAELRDVFENRCSERIGAEFTDRVAQLHDSDPTCVLDDAANRVLRWQLGRVTPGTLGNFTLEPATFDRLDDAMRAVFAARREAFLTVGQAPLASTQTTDEGASK